MRAAVRTILPAALAVMALAWAPAASAAVADNTGEIELHAGWYFPDEQDDESLDDLVYGIRFGYNFAQHFGMQLDISTFDTEWEIAGADFEYDQWMADVSLEWQINPDDRAVFHLYGGPGYVWSEFDAPGTGFDFDDDFFSLHVGVGLQVGITDHFYFRPDVRARWFDSDDDGSFRDDSSFDWQAGLALGFYLGQNAGAAGQ